MSPPHPATDQYSPPPDVVATIRQVTTRALAGHVLAIAAAHGNRFRLDVLGEILARASDAELAELHRPLPRERQR